MRKSYFLFTFAVIFAACSKSNDSVVNPPAADNNLLSNGSFEVNGVASLMGWRANPSDSTYVSLSTDVPPQGGLFSIRLKNQWTFAGRVVAVLPASPGIHRYRLSAFAKCAPNIYHPLANQAYMRLTLRSPDSVLRFQSLSFADSTWATGSTVDTLNATVGDSIDVFLSGSIGQWSNGYTFFDLCKLEKLD